MQVIWRRSSDPNPLTIGEDVYVSDSRYKASERPAEKEWILTIADVQIADAGVYECQVSSKTKLIFHILLHVNGEFLAFERIRNGRYCETK